MNQHLLNQYLIELLTYDPNQRIGADLLELADHLLMIKISYKATPWLWHSFLKDHLKEIQFKHVDMLYHKHGRHEIIKDIWAAKEDIIKASKQSAEKNETHDRKEDVLRMEL